MDSEEGASISIENPSTSSQSRDSTSNVDSVERPSVSKESSVDCEDEQSISREDNKIYNMENYQYDFDANDTLTQERNEIEKAIKNKQITPGRAKLQLWLYRSMRIVMTDGRILIGIFLCTDSDANVILGVCSEYTKNGGDERMLGLVMVPGMIAVFLLSREFFMKKILCSIQFHKLMLLHSISRATHCHNAFGYSHVKRAVKANCLTSLCKIRYQ